MPPSEAHGVRVKKEQQKKYPKCVFTYLFGREGRRDRGRQTDEHPHCFMLKCLQHLVLVQKPGLQIKSLIGMAETQAFAVSSGPEVVT